jgi:hypothetical protein
MVFNAGLRLQQAAMKTHLIFTAGSSQQPVMKMNFTTGSIKNRW